jgi:hypothetical protein
MAHVRRWQWILLALLAGWLVGFAQNQLDPDPIAGIPNSISQKSSGRDMGFEELLVTTYTTAEGHKYFQLRGLTVELAPDIRDEPTSATTSPAKGRKAAQRLMYVVKGYKLPRENLDLALKKNPDGSVTRVSIPTPLLSYLLLPYGKYEPYYDPPGPAVAYQPSFMQRLCERLGIKEPDPPGSILDYLASVQAANGNTFRYLWWKEPGVRTASCMAGSFAIFGLILPTLINIMAFGSVFQPKREKGVSLRHVKGSGRKKAEAPKPKVTEQDLEQLRAIEADLEAKLAGNTVSDSPTPQPDADRRPSAVKKLASDGATSQAVVIDKHDDKDYGRKTGDWYPTERLHQDKAPGPESQSKKSG